MDLDDGRSTLDDHPSLRRTSSFTALPSTVLPASSAMTAFITFPMSLGDVAPVDCNGRVNHALEVGRIDRWRQVAFENHDLRRFLVDEILPAAFDELLDRVAALLDQRRHDLERLVVVERTAALDFPVHQRRLQHAQRAEPRADPSISSRR